MKLSRLTLVILALILTACGGGDDADVASPATTVGLSASTAPGEAGDGDTDDDGSDSDDSLTETDDDDDTGDGEDGQGEDGEGSSGGLDPSVPDQLIPGDDVLRLAPAADSPRGVLWYWTPEQAGWFGHTGAWTGWAGGPLVELADGYLGGMAVQRADRDQAVWLATTEEDRELLVAADQQHLLLEGAWTDGDRTLFYYQRFDEGGTVETTEATLRALDPFSGEVVEVMQTGGWESGTAFNHISGQVAVGRWSGEGYSGLIIVDLATGDLLHDTRDVACFDGEPGCIVYDAATMVGDEVYGVRPILNGDVVEAMGLFHYDPATRTDELVVSYAWEIDQWFVEDIFSLGGEVVVSLHDGDDRPLPALMIDVATGDAVTQPLAAFVRPGYLS